MGTTTTVETGKAGAGGARKADAAKAGAAADAEGKDKTAVGSTGPPPAPAGTVRTLLGLTRRALPSALELLAVSSFVFARPLFASFGRSPETFVARGADWPGVVGFALAVLLGPVLGILVAEALVGLVVGERARRAVHMVAVLGLLTLMAWQIVDDLVDLRPRLLGLVSVGVAALVLVAWVRFTVVPQFFRYASAGAAVFAVQLLLLSPTSSIVLGGRHAAADLGDVGVPAGAPPVVLVIMDGLPTGLLLDGEGRIDADLYPNIAALAADATWYRNHTTVAQVTLQAVPAILSGQQPDADEEPALASNYGRNIFTLLAASHEIHGGEQITGVCPVEVCPTPAGSAVGGLLRDAADIWRLRMTGEAVDPELVPYVFQRRADRDSAWIADQDFATAGRPGLYVRHLLLPHPSWEYLPDGSEYRAAGRRPTGLFLDGWGGWGEDVARQRHVLQTQLADRLLGRLLDRLRDAGTYDDALVVLTSDHGYAFADGEPWRGIDAGNADQIAWTPLIVKSPRQTEAVVDDRNVNSLDVVPTIAAEVGVDEMPWDAPGAPAGTVERDPGDKWIVDWQHGHLHPEGDGEVVPIDGVEGFERMLATDPVEGAGRLAVWRRTEHGALVGEDVAGLEVGEPAERELAVAGLDGWDDVDAERPPLELVAQSPVSDNARVAITVNDTVAAVVPAHLTGYGVAIVHALLWPGALTAGHNEIGAYLVDGPPDAPVLHELEVVGQGG